MSARLQGAIGWAALLSAAVSVILIGGNFPLGWVTLALVSLVLFVLQSVLDLGGWRQAGPTVPIVPAAALYSLALVWGAFQVAAGAPPALAHPDWAAVDGPASIALDPVEGRHVLARLTAYAMLFWTAVRAASDPYRARAFIAFIALFSSALAGYGILTLLVGYNWLTMAETSRILTASFVNRNSYATFAGFGILANLAALGLAMEDRRRRQGAAPLGMRDVVETLAGGAWIYLFGLALVAAALALTVSRGGILATFAGLFVYLALMRRGTAAGGLDRFGGVAALMIAAYAAGIGLAAFLGRVLDITGDEARFKVYPAMVEAIADRPLLGVGPGGFQEAFGRYLPAEAAMREWDLAHNTYLENMMELGLPGFLLLFTAVFLVALTLFRGVQTRRRMVAAPAFALAVLVVAGLHSLVDFSLQMPGTAAMFAIILGIGWAQSFSSRLATGSS